MEEKGEGEEDKHLQDVGTSKLSQMQTQTALKKIKKKKTNTVECERHTYHFTHAEKLSPCSGMNRALHTWNFLGHHATLHYHCSPLRELYPVFSLWRAQKAPKTHDAPYETSNRRPQKITQARARTPANNSAEKKDGDKEKRLAA